MKKKIIIGVALALVIGICIFLIINFSSKKSSNNKNNSSSKTTIEDNVSEVEWGTYDSNDITLSKSIKITEGGIYNLTGTIKDGYILIDTEEEVKIVLNNVNITNSTGPAILITNAKLVEIELADNSKNFLEDGNTYSEDNASYDGVIYSKSDLVLSGTGSLEVKANFADAIVSKDNLKINDGTYIITSIDDGIRGKDSVYIVNGTFNIESSGDAIKSTNEEEEEKGYINIENGTYTINSKQDGISAITSLIINDGIFNIITTQINSDTSAKGLKADKVITLNGGTFTITSTDDGIHTNGNITINNGTYTITSDDDAIHADGMIEINKGDFTITAHEGIEATYVKFNDGNINISASDDGINAANKSSDYNPTVEINGGSITIKMGQGDTDGIDSNGDIIINGGTIDITGQSSFDYDGKAEYNGGTIIINGVETTTIQNQMMGGGMQGNPENGVMPNGEMPGNQGNMPNRGNRRQF